MGNAWYEEGKLSKKPNTFYDFIACAEYLIRVGDVRVYFAQLLIDCVLVGGIYVF